VLNHLPILQVILPLLGAPACLLLSGRCNAWLFSCLVALSTVVISGLLFYQVQMTGPISYELGGWDAPWGIEYRIDQLTTFVLLLVSVVSLLVLLGAKVSVETEIPGDRQVMFYVLYLLCQAGLLGIVATGDIFNVFVFLEISSLATYALIALGRDRRALWAAYQYLIVGTIGATFILVGIGFLFSLTGTLTMADLALRLPDIADSKAVYAAFAFMVVGVCLKLALFPLHLWLPNAYAYAPSIVTAFLAATATKVAVYLLVRLHFSVFGAGFADSAVPLEAIFIVLGLAGVFVASSVAIYEDDIKRLFAYSSVAQIGYMIIGMGIGTSIGVQATLLHLFNHSVMKAALFLALAAVVCRVGGASLNDFRGLGKVMPLTMAAIVVACLSLIGVPLTVGFVSKWYLVTGAIDAGMWWLALLVVLGSVLALLYTWRLVEAAYFCAPAEGCDTRCEAPLGLLIPLGLLVFANVYLGIDTRLTVESTSLAVDHLMRGGE
jgi:multicomponent Na+:H+ antiporter subunit D